VIKPTQLITKKLPALQEILNIHSVAQGWVSVSKNWVRGHQKPVLSCNQVSIDQFQTNQDNCSNKKCTILWIQLPVSKEQKTQWEMSWL